MHSYQSVNEYDQRDKNNANRAYSGSALRKSNSPTLTAYSLDSTRNLIEVTVGHAT